MKNKKNTAVVILIVAIAMVLILIIGAVAVVFLRKGNSQPEPENVTESESTEVLTDADRLFEKYGNFKDYDSMVNIIHNTSEDAESVKKEVFAYWFVLICYGDYEDAYTYVASDVAEAYGYSCAYEEFVEDCQDLLSISEEPVGLRADILERTTPVTYSNSFGLTEKSMVMIYGEDEGDAVYRTMLLLDDCRIVPFDCTESGHGYRPMAADSQSAGDTYIEDETTEPESATGTDSVTTETTEEGESNGREE